MAEPQGEGQGAGEAAPPPRGQGFSWLEVAALAPVVVVLAIAFSQWLRVERGPHAGVGAGGELAARGPDPSRVYTIETASAPARGPDQAPVTVTEFGDFQ